MEQEYGKTALHPGAIPIVLQVLFVFSAPVTTSKLSVPFSLTSGLDE